uniref:Uncharacterized protein n=1 Tax=Mycena chlorophos TaxID=658473 RepID=A0ABQ0LFH6_MYCCL|nr:predicted protein [Mycena chlorophos]
MYPAGGPSVDEDARNSVLNSYAASGLVTPEGMAELEAFLRVCPPHSVSHVQDVIDTLQHAQATDVPYIVHKDPPPGVELYYYDIPNTELRVLYHEFVRPRTAAYANVAFQWNFYIRSSKQQALDYIPLVELEGFCENEWDAIQLYIAPSAGVLRIDKQHIV